MKIAAQLWLVFALLAAGRVSAAGVQPPPEAALKYPDGGTIHADGVVVPPSLKKSRAPEEPEPALPFIALGSPDVLAALGDPRPEIGSWAEYIVTEHGKQTTRVLISVLPPVMPDGRYWLEIDTLNELALPMALRILTRGNPGVAANIERAIVQVPGQTLFEVPMTALPKQHQKPPPGNSGAKIETSHEVKIKVHAGSFTSDKIHLAKGKESFTVWRSNEVPVLGLLRSESAGRITELQAMGHSGAHSLINGPIVDENLPPGTQPADDAAPDQGNGSDNK